jgi:uncharacterized protein
MGHKKATTNLKKHRVSFQESASVFGDPMAITFDDPDHSVGERRLLTFGVTRTEKFVIVSHTRDADINRIISVRTMRNKSGDSLLNSTCHEEEKPPA